MTTYKATANRTGRVMNSQMNVSLPVEMHERLRELAWQERIPLSHLCRQLLEAGLTIRDEGRANGVEEKPPEPLREIRREPCIKDVI